MWQSGQILQGRYELTQQLGQNAGRQTWLAMDLNSSPAAPVIVKLLAFNPQMQWDDLKLFEREAQVLKTIAHPRIPQYREYFSLAEGEGAGLPWFGLVQTYIPGHSLKQLLDKGKRFTETQVRAIAIEILKILINLHELSPPILHRDIKPSNLILGEDHHMYLVDFGAVQDKAKAEGVTFTVVGTSGYAPPEQLWGKAIAASDLYALGATLIHLLTGTPPAQLPQQQMRIQFSDRLPIHPDFARWLEQLIQPAPEKRFSTARQALSALKITQAHAEHKNSSQAVNSSPNYLVGCLLVPLLAFLGLLPWVLMTFPSLLSSSTKAKQAEAKTYVGSMNRAHQAYFLEKKAFTNNVDKLGLAIKTETVNYSYSLHTTKNAAFHYGVSKVKKTPWQKLLGHKELKSYVGGVFLYRVGGTGDLRTLAILCEANSPGSIKPPEPTYRNGVLACSAGTRDLSQRSY
ncbi:MAG TPA: hypothetical protein DDZ80_13390 [Cyanobacteria bacterium UBA8803]|nr:hypothetical protein [Cyanobacteria bacterium UBA9273]HBL59464.1 hypothetical protein [Cyanobacteria bacterium UBA8803]